MEQTDYYSQPMKLAGNKKFKPDSNKWSGLNFNHRVC